MNQGAAAAPGGARASRAAFIVGGIFALVGLLAPLALLIGMRQGREMLLEGGIISWVLVALAVVSAAAILPYGIAIARRPGWPSLPLMILPPLLPLVAWAGAAYATKLSREAVLSHSVDPSQKATILAAGIAESLHLTRLAASAACLLLSLVALLVGARALGRVSSAPGLGRAIAVAASGGFLILLVAVAPVAIGYPVHVLAPVAALAAVAAAAMGAAALACPDEQAGPDDRSAALADTLFAVAAGAGGAAFGVVAARAGQLTMAFGAVAAHSVDPAQKAHIMSVALREVQLGVWFGLAVALPLLVAGAVPALLRLGDLGRALARAWPGLVLALVYAGVLAPLLAWQSSAAWDDIGQIWRAEPARERPAVRAP